MFGYNTILQDQMRRLAQKVRFDFLIIRVDRKIKYRRLDQKHRLEAQIRSLYYNVWLATKSTILYSKINSEYYIILLYYTV